MGRGTWHSATRRSRFSRHGYAPFRQMTVGALLLPPWLRAAIDNAIATSQHAWSQFVRDNTENSAADAKVLAVKYVESKWAETYLRASSGLYIGEKHYTWGRGVYVTGIEEPLSTAIYGRVGIVARFDPAGWKAFDARDPVNRNLYLTWLHAQPDYPEAVLTVHAGYWLHEFRNLFREQFGIDVVLFAPDELDVSGWYTQKTDTWLAVSDWAAPNRLAAGASTRFSDARMTILIEEEFRPDTPALTRSPTLVISGGAPPTHNLPALARAAYAAGRLERQES